MIHFRGVTCIASQRSIDPLSIIIQKGNRGVRKFTKTPKGIFFCLTPPVQNLDGLNRVRVSQINLPPDATSTPAGMREAALVVINCFGSSKHCFALEIRRLRRTLASGDIEARRMT
jgi:hypothetical protein